MHHMFVGNEKSPAVIRTLVFDDSLGYLGTDQSFAADAPHAWLAFNHDMTKIYGVSHESARLATYSVVNNSYIRLANAIEFKGRCANKPASFVLASNRFPNYVFTSSWPSNNACGETSYVDPMGEARGMASSWVYSNKSTVHGMEFGRGFGQILYSADQGADAIWTHAFGFYGETYYLGRYNVPPGSGPKRLATHPFGKYMYAIMENTNLLVPYLLDPFTNIVRYNDTSYSLLPHDLSASDFLAADLSLARNGNYLWAITQARPNTPHPGYISGFLLDDDGGVIKKMFTVPTSTKGGGQYAIAPAPWGSEWAAITDGSKGSVEMWQMNQGRDSMYGTDYQSAQAVARADITDGGCCANAIWYS